MLLFSILLAIEFPFLCCLIHISLNRTFSSTGESCGSNFVNVSVFGFFAHAMLAPRQSAASKAFVWIGAPSDCLLLESCGFCTCTNIRLLLSMRRLKRTVPTPLRLSLPLKILARFVYKIFLAQRSSVQNDRDFQPVRMSKSTRQFRVLRKY